jgi:lipoprotein-anchoring transpeptidase ErfK/SrfK
VKTIAVNAATQEAVLYDSDTIVGRYVISTAKNGLSCEANSFCTPTGNLEIAQKIGQGLPIGTVLIGRVPTKEVWSSAPSNPLSMSKEDLVLSRILWLKGCEAQNENTYVRCIYMHGTNHEDMLGKPASHGCIRFSNKDIIELFDLVDVGDEVVVTS